MKIGAQLYTVREFAKTREGLLKALDQVAAMGYDGVQFSGLECMDGDAPEVSAGDAAEMARSRNLAAAATHKMWRRIKDRVEEEIDYHRELGAPFVAVPAPPDEARQGGPAEYRAWIRELRPVAERFREAGLTLGYHNHSFEFERFGEQGERPFDVLVDEAPWLAMEIDTYWVHHSGAEVVETIHRLKGRVPFVHLKDMAMFGREVDYAPVGEGNLNWPKILAALREAGAEWLFVEQDTCRRDPFDCLASSARYLRSALVD